MYGMNSNINFNSNLMLPSSRAHLINAKVKNDTFFQRYFYSTENAYYFSNGIILDLTSNVVRNLDIKPHPSVSQTLSDEKNITRYPRYFPAEFMPFISDLKYECVVGFSSSSIKNLPKLLEIPKVVSYSLAFCVKSYLVFRLYMSYVICNRLFTGNFVSFGIDKELLQNINLYSDIDFPISNEYKPLTNLNKSQPFMILDNSAYEKEDFTSQLVAYIQKMAVNDVMVAINSKDDYAFICEDFDFTDFMIPVVIHKKVCSDHAVGNFQDETIYFFCKNEDIRNRITSFHYCRQLYYTGIELSVTPLSENEMNIQRQQMFVRRENLLQSRALEKKIELLCAEEEKG